MIGPVPPELLVSPPGYTGTVWPPTVDAALADVAGKRPQHYPARYIVLGCALAHAATQDADLLAAYRCFVEISTLTSAASQANRRDAQRGLAAVNAAPTLVALGHRGAALLALKELDHAKGLCDGVEGLAETVRSAAAYVVSHILQLQQPAPTRWRSDRIVPTSHTASQRVGWMPRHRVHGTWLGVSAVVANWGLEVPASAPYGPQDVVTMARAPGDDLALVVGAWQPCHLIQEIAVRVGR